MWPDDPDWQMTVLFLLALALLGFAMKLVALLLSVDTHAGRPFMSWILPLPNSIARSRPVAGVQSVLFRVALLFGAVLLSYWVYGQLVRGFDVRGILLSYVAVPILLLMTEFLVAVATLIFLPGGRLLPALHRRPWMARSIADFWGHRWNLWFSDWFRHVMFTRLRRRPMFALFLVFAVSGLMHEWVLNVPLYRLAGTALLGTMTVYFLLQAAGILVERNFLRGHPRLMKAFVWMIVVVPAPLVVNEGLLRVLHLWPE